jgi:hypothetical protein
MNKVEERKLKRAKELKKLNGTYQYNEQKRAVTYFIVTKGEVITGTAKCNTNDVFDRRIGEQIAYRRAHLNQRQRDLFLLREFIDDIKSIIESYKDDNLIYCKHYEIAAMNACEEERAQLDQIRTLECEIHELIKYGRVLSKVERAEKKLGRSLTPQELDEINSYGVILTNRMRTKLAKANRIVQAVEVEPGTEVQTA